MIYCSYTDKIGAIKHDLYQVREFRGPLAGFYSVTPMVCFRGFLWEPKKAVMDDFGNLVAVEG